MRLRADQIGEWLDEWCQASEARRQRQEREIKLKARFVFLLQLSWFLSAIAAIGTIFLTTVIGGGLSLPVTLILGAYIATALFALMNFQLTWRLAEGMARRWVEFTAPPKLID